MKIIQCIFSKLFSRKSTKDDVVSCAKNFKFNQYVPGISQDTGRITRKLEGLQKSVKKIGLGKDNSEKFNHGKKILFRAVCGSGILVTVVAIVVITGFGSHLSSLVERIEYFHIQDINISGCVVTDRNLIRNQAGVGYSTSVLTLSEGDVASRLTSHPWVESVKVNVKFPNTLFISVNEYVPEALISLGEQEEQELYYIAKNGLPFSKVGTKDDIDYPVITGLTSLEEIRKNDGLAMDIFAFIKQAKRNDPKLPIQSISEIHVSTDFDLVIYLVDHPFPIYMGRGEMKEKYGQLLKVLGVLYRKHRKGAKIAKVASIRMDYFGDKALVSLND